MPFGLRSRYNARVTDPVDAALDVLDRAESEFEHGRFDVALDLSVATLAALDRVAEPVDDLRIACLRIAAEANLALGDFGQAREQIECMRACDGGGDEAEFVSGRLALESWDIEGAAAAFDRCSLHGDAAAEVAWHRAIVAELRSDFDAADSWYRKAFELDPDFSLPVRIEFDTAMSLLEELIAAFPEDVRNTFENMQIDLLEVPDLEADRKSDLSPLILGYYDGLPLTERESGIAYGPDRIRIFKRNIERSVDSVEELREELRITLLHEVGHHLGWDEDELHERGIG